MTGEVWDSAQHKPSGVQVTTCSGTTIVDVPDPQPSGMSLLGDHVSNFICIKLEEAPL